MDRFNNIIKKEKNKNISFIALTLTIVLILVIIIAIIVPNVNFANNNSLENVIDISNEIGTTQEDESVLLPENSSNTNLIKPLKISVTPSESFNGKEHLGIDFPAETGTEIVASQSGKVIFSEYKGGYGKMIIIEHEDGLFTLYSQCSKLLVKENEQVAQGQVIAEVGSTGNSTGPHLHFEVRKNGIAQDPTEYISF